MVSNHQLARHSDSDRRGENRRARTTFALQLPPASTAVPRTTPPSSWTRPSETAHADDIHATLTSCRPRRCNDRDPAARTQHHRCKDRHDHRTAEDGRTPRRVDRRASSASRWIHRPPPPQSTDGSPPACCMTGRSTSSGTSNAKASSMPPSPTPLDYYLVMTGPSAPAAH